MQRPWLRGQRTTAPPASGRSTTRCTTGLSFVYDSNGYNIEVRLAYGTKRFFHEVGLGSTSSAYLAMMVGMHLNCISPMALRPATTCTRAYGAYVLNTCRHVLCHSLT